MDEILAMLFVAGFVGICILECIIAARRSKRHQRIRDTGERVTAKVVSVRQWRDKSLVDDVGPTSPFRYQIRAAWANPLNHTFQTLKSEIKVGLCPYQIGNDVPVYISPEGRYMDIL